MLSVRGRGPRGMSYPTTSVPFILEVMGGGQKTRLSVGLEGYKRRLI